MEALWFVILVFMLTMYVVLDGFDFGAGMIYLWVARSDADRRDVLAAIGPVWNGNEVWLIASGGLLFFAFPRAYAAGFSGFYLALMMVLWLFMLRGLALELRTHFTHTLWTAFWDAGFAVASVLLALVFGAALGNLLRGVPLNAEGYFFTALWTDFTPGSEPGILDWYTVLVALTTGAILASHGASYVVMKTRGDVATRARGLATGAQWVTAIFLVGTCLATLFVQPTITGNFLAHPVGLGFVVLAVGGYVLAVVAHRQRRETGAFAASSAMIFGLLCSAAWGMFPNLLVASNDAAYSLTIHNAAASAHGLALGLGWFIVGISLVLGYSVVVHRLFWGKVGMAQEKSAA